MQRVLSFVSVTFRDQNKRTKVAEGPFPHYNQILEFPFVPPNNDFSPENLKWIQSQMYFDIFDEVTVDELKDERDFNLHNQRSELRWLGSFSIPFSTIYQNGKVRPIVVISLLFRFGELFASKLHPFISTTITHTLRTHLFILHLL